MKGKAEQSLADSNSQSLGKDWHCTTCLLSSCSALRRSPFIHFPLWPHEVGTGRCALFEDCMACTVWGQRSCRSQTITGISSQAVLSLAIKSPPLLNDAFHLLSCQFHLKIVIDAHYI